MLNDVRKKQASGFSLIEAMVGVGVLGILSISSMSLISLFVNQQKQYLRTNQVYEARQRILDFFIKDHLWESTIRAHTQIDPGDLIYQMNTLQQRNVSPQSMGPFSIALLSHNNGVPGAEVIDYDFRTINSVRGGFNWAGQPCSNFGDSASAANRDQCPFTVNITWIPVCPGGLAPPNCQNPTAFVSADFEYQPGTNSQPFNADKLNFSVRAGSVHADLKSNCQRVGGVWDLTTDHCTFDQLYCTTDPLKPYFRGWNPDNSPKCLGKCEDDAFPILMGWDATDQPICREISKKLPAGQHEATNEFICAPGFVLRGVGPSGDLVCEPPIKAAAQNPTPMSSRVYSCASANQKVDTIYEDGSVKCVDTVVSSNSLTCAADEEFQGVNVDGSPICRARKLANVSCQEGGQIFGYDSSGNPQCRYTGCPLPAFGTPPNGENPEFATGQTSALGDPICRVSWLVNIPFSMTVQEDNVIRSPEQTCGTKMRRAHVGPNTFTNHNYAGVIADPTSGVWFGLPSECTGIAGENQNCNLSPGGEPIQLQIQRFSDSILGDRLWVFGSNPLSGGGPAFVSGEAWALCMFDYPRVLETTNPTNY